MTKDEFNKQLGDFIKTEREKRNWSQAELASKMGNNFQNISRLERGEVSPTLFWLDKLAKVFDKLSSEFISDFELFIALSEKQKNGKG